MGDVQAPASDPVLESHTHQDAARDDAQGPDRRDRRSRDRYGRDRRERGDRPARDEAADASAQTGAMPAVQAASMEEDNRPRYPTGFVTEESADANGPVAAEAPVAAVSPALADVPPAPAVTVEAPVLVSAAPSPKGLPKVRPFELPVADLVQVAAGSGLQWVNSDAEKIAAVQAAIAMEPRPAHVPRERPAPIVVDEGPLVLVETKRDLRDLKLPFEQTSLPLQ